MSFDGTAHIEFSIDNEDDINLENPIKFSHTFWIASEADDSCKNNILGMDWIQKQCKQITFEDRCNKTILKKYPDISIQLLSKIATEFPYFENLKVI